MVRFERWVLVVGYETDLCGRCEIRGWGGFLVWKKDYSISGSCTYEKKKPEISYYWMLLRSMMTTRGHDED